MDPIGFALENFDAVGAWRTHEPGGPIDTSAELPDGITVEGPVTLRQALVKRPEVFVTTLAEKMMTYGLGRGLTYHDMPTIRSVVRSSEANRYRFSAVVLAIVKSEPFRMKLKS